MAYFANGTEGGILDEQCHNCLHGLNDDVLCPVALVQVTYNYAQLHQPDLQTALIMLVDEHGACQMRRALERAGVVIDLSERDQMLLL